jgi:hypothetical protein
MFDAVSYLQDRGIPFDTEGKNCSPGWVQIQCPFHPDSNHGGFRLLDGAYRCWKCGWHSIENTIIALENCSYTQACRRLIDYDTPEIPDISIRTPVTKKSTLEWPKGIGAMSKIHFDYLLNRNFNPKYLQEKYHLLGGKPYGDYKYRLIIPIIVDSQIVSFQGRDITDTQELRYKACKKEDEVIDHKNTLYNIDNAGDTGIIVEGVFDVWRLGDNTVATFGTAVRRHQVLEIIRRFKKVFVLFDPEPEAQKKAKDLVRELNVYIDAINIKLKPLSNTIPTWKGDPADLPQDKADELKYNLLGGK